MKPVTLQRFLEVSARAAALVLSLLAPAAWSPASAAAGDADRFAGNCAKLAYVALGLIEGVGSSGLDLNAPEARKTKAYWESIWDFYASIAKEKFTFDEIKKLAIQEMTAWEKK